MIGFAESFLAWTAATFIPGFLGLFIITWAGRRFSPTYIIAFALGIFLWFFVDTISGSAVLDVNSGFTGGLAQLGVVVLFLFGFLFLMTIERNRGIFNPESAIGKYGMIIPMLAAIAIGIHGLGEGAAFGATAYSTSSTSLLDAFGGLTAGVAYFLHKGLEPMMIGAIYVAYYNWKGAKIATWFKNSLIMTILFVLPSLIGAATGYFYNWDATYAFALGTGTSVYAVLRLAAPLFPTTSAAPSKPTMKIAIALVLGFMAIYFAALFHS